MRVRRKDEGRRSSSGAVVSQAGTEATKKSDPFRGERARERGNESGQMQPPLLLGGRQKRL